MVFAGGHCAYMWHGVQAGQEDGMLVVPASSSASCVILINSLYFAVTAGDRVG